MRLNIKLLLGIDIGTSACKVTLFDFNGAVVASASESYSINYPKPGWAEQNPDLWWAALCKALKCLWEKADVSPLTVAGVGIAGQSWAAVFTDRNGDVLCPSPLWFDTRAADICTETENLIGQKQIFEISGNPFKPSYTMPKIIWLKRNMPDIYEKAVHVMQSNSFIGYRLTGTVTQDVSQGYGLHCFNLRKGIYDFTLCEEMGIKKSLLPEIVPCHKIIGTVTKEATAACGLVEGTPVVAGGLDAACGTLGAGVVSPGQTQLQGGQAGGMSIATNEYKLSPVLINGFHVVPGLWLVQGGTVGGGGVLRWFRKQFGDNNSFDDLTALAEKVPAGADGLVFLPYMAGERSPIWDENAKAVFYGLDYTKTKAHFIRAVLEGTAFSLRHNLEAAAEAGTFASEMRAMGGAANSPLWMQIYSDITGKGIEVSSSDTATTLGAAILAGVAAGVYNTFEDAVSKTVSVKKIYKPSNYNAYEKNYEIYRKLYTQLSGLTERTEGS